MRLTLSEVHTVDIPFLVKGLFFASVVSFSAQCGLIVLKDHSVSHGSESAAEAKQGPLIPELTTLPPDFLKVADNIIHSQLLGYVDESTGVQSMPSLQIDELARNLRLTGVVELDRNEALIKDASTGATFFVGEGDALRGMTVRKIKDNVILLELGNATKEIRLEA